MSVLYFRQHSVTILKYSSDTHPSTYAFIETLEQSENNPEGYFDKCSDISTLYTRLRSYAYMRCRYVDKHVETDSIASFFYAYLFAQNTNGSKEEEEESDDEDMKDDNDNKGSDSMNGDDSKSSDSRNDDGSESKDDDDSSSKDDDDSSSKDDRSNNDDSSSSEDSCDDDNPTGNLHAAGSRNKKRIHTLADPSTEDGAPKKKKSE